jgi:hypothetical protein
MGNIAPRSRLFWAQTATERVENGPWMARNGTLLADVAASSQSAQAQGEQRITAQLSWRGWQNLQMI